MYECALGIGAFTWDEVHNKLDIVQAQVLQIKRQMSEAPKREVSLAGMHHTWRSLLYLIHRCPYLPSTAQDKHLPVFMN
ncbi:hypothetical protein [Alicyclobacillus suci]|uniref:hypothetical protein n=1 Tax=Alicyclobacillus suci TaxID=2816080 RepID=UPI001A8C3240|nr:hypothetical protein [Alicyclobacillus suci]